MRCRFNAKEKLQAWVKLDVEEREPVRSQVDGDVKDESETKDGHQDEGEDKVRKHIMDESENERLHI